MSFILARRSYLRAVIAQYFQIALGYHGVRTYKL